MTATPTSLERVDESFRLMSPNPTVAIIVTTKYTASIQLRCSARRKYVVARMKIEPMTITARIARGSGRHGRLSSLSRGAMASSDGVASGGRGASMAPMKCDAASSGGLMNANDCRCRASFSPSGLWVSAMTIGTLALARRTARAMRMLTSSSSVTA